MEGFHEWSCPPRQYTRPIHDKVGTGMCVPADESKRPKPIE